MQKPNLIASFIAVATVLLLTNCSEGRTDDHTQEKPNSAVAQAEGEKTTDLDLQSQLKEGEHLVLIGGCHDCHTPKKMTDRGPVPDFSLALSGHPAQMPPPDVNRAEIEKKGLAVTQTLTAWVGPWGISYSANITSDKTGIGNWTEQNFITSIREGKFKGQPNGRPILPPMPWEMIAHMTDDELKAVFAYLKSTKPINNVVPAPQPPLAAAGAAAR